MITANPKWIKTTPYYDEFLRYYQMAKTQQEECNLGIIKHADSSVPDDLMKHVELYDVCLLYTSPSPRDRTRSRMPSSA